MPSYPNNGFFFSKTYLSYADFPIEGTDYTLYETQDDGNLYRWNSFTVAYERVNLDVIPPDPLPLTFANAATVGVLSYSPVYDNGPLNDGVDATLIGSTAGALRDTSAVGRIDSVYIPIVGDVVLVKNQASVLENGLYEITVVGDVSTPYTLTRVVDFDQADELYPLQVNVLEGTTNTLKYFIQTTVNPVIGVDSLVFSTTSIPNVTTITQIAFVDTVIDTPLSNIVYANGTNPSIPGSGATITSTVNGLLGTWYGLTANTNSTIPGSFTRVLLMNQTNPAHNGDYQVLSAGSATTSTKWKLRRINNTAGGFDRYTRHFVVSNISSFKAGNVYFTKPNSPILTNATIGTSAIGIHEYGKKYNSYVALVSQVTPVTSTSGSLIVGETYTLTTYVSGDDFSNVAQVQSGTINTSGCIFIATGTTPTNWTNGSTLVSWGNPTAIVLENSIGGITFHRSGTGVYTATRLGAFPLNKTFVLGGSPDVTGSGGGDFATLDIRRLDNDTITLSVFDNFTLRDSLLVNTSIEIRVYI